MFMTKRTRQDLPDFYETLFLTMKDTKLTKIGTGEAIFYPQISEP